MSAPDLLGRLTPAERRGLENIATQSGLAAERLAAEMVAAYLRLLLDAPEALCTERPLLGLIRRGRARK